jgi:hypothetical protein
MNINFSWTYINELIKKHINLIQKAFILFILLFILTGNITNSFLLKWGFRDNYDHQYSVESMIANNAEKPFIYRSQLPKLLFKLTEQFDDETQNLLFIKIIRYDDLRKHYFSNIPIEIWTPKLAITYHFLYLVIVLCTFFTLLYVYKISLYAFNDNFTNGLLSVSVFSFIYPLSFQNGGYYYDFVELLVIFATTYHFLKENFTKTIIFLLVGSFNKETCFLFPFFLYFLHKNDVPKKIKMGIFILQMIPCLFGYIYITSGYLSNAGNAADLQIIQNLNFWLNPSIYFKFNNHIGKGIPTPEVQNLIFLIPFFLLFKTGWKKAAQSHKEFLFASLGVCSLLLLFVGFKNEYRNLSLSFPAIFLVLKSGIDTYFDYLNKN